MSNKQNEESEFEFKLDLGDDDAEVDLKGLESSDDFGDDDAGGIEEDNNEGSERANEDEGNDDAEAERLREQDERDARIAELEARAEAAEQARLAAEEKSIQHEKRVVDGNLAQLATLEENIKHRRTALNAQLASAREEGDTAKTIEIESLIDDLREKSSEANRLKSVFEQQKAELSQKLTEERKPQQPQQPQSPQEVKQWLDRNPWFVEPRTEAEATKKFRAEKIRKELNNDRRYLSANGQPTREYFKEFDRRIADMANKQNGRGNRPQSHVSGVNNGASSAKQGNKQNKVVLNPSDVKGMRAANVLGKLQSNKALAKGFASMERQAEKNPGGWITIPEL